MTRAVQQPRVDPHLRRPGIVYGIPIVDPKSGEVRIDYVGRTRNLRRREAEHLVDQPFGDLIRGGLIVIEQGVWTDAELDARETYQIVRLRPRYNFEKNEHNPHRIPIFLAWEQRWARDRAAGRPLWVPPEDRDAAASSAWARRWLGRLRRTRRRLRAAWRYRPVRWSAAWSALFGGLFLLTPDRVPAGSAAGGCAFAATLTLVLARPRTRPSRRRRRTRR